VFKTISILIGNSERTIFKWKKENRPILSLLEKYFTKDDLAEFLETEKIEKFDNILKIQNIVINNNINKYIDTFIQKTQSNTIKFSGNFFIDFYFSFLSYFNKFDMEKSFSCLIHDYLIDYSSDKYMYPLQLKTINNYLYLFNDFDDLMTIFLSQSLNNNFAELLDNDDYSIGLNKLKKDEAYFHIIGLYFYTNHSSLNPNLKIELIKSFSGRTIDKFFSFDMLINFIKENEVNTIQAFKESYDKPLYDIVTLKADK